MHDIFYFTDVHGHLDLFQTMRDWCYEQDPECTIIFGGDACDRGEFGFDIMEMILDDPQIIYIRGNHEDMFIKAARELIANNPTIKNKFLTTNEANDLVCRESWLHYVRLSVMNGGRSTLVSWLTSGTSLDFLNRLEERTCYTLQIDNDLYFSHAGGREEVFNKVNEHEYCGTGIDAEDRKEVLWDRDFLGDWWDEKKTIIFGHTPTYYFHDMFPDKCPELFDTTVKPVAYKPHENTGWHIGMDTGMVWTGRGYVLNCLTMQVYGFRDPDNGYTHQNKTIEQFETFKII